MNPSDDPTRCDVVIDILDDLLLMIDDRVELRRLADRLSRLAAEVLASEAAV